MLDLVAAAGRRAAAAAVAASSGARAAGPVLVCCALGFQRSAGVVAAWLVATGRAATRDAAPQPCLRLPAGRCISTSPASHGERRHDGDADISEAERFAARLLRQAGCGRSCWSPWPSSLAVSPRGTPPRPGTVRSPLVAAAVGARDARACRRCSASTRCCFG